MENQAQHVTEEEMKAFFNRLVTSFVAASDQAKKLDDLTARFADTEKQVQSISAENANIRQELYRTVVERDKAQREVEVYKGLSESYQKDADELRQRVQRISSELDKTYVTLGQLEQANRGLEDKLRYSEETLRGTDNDRNFWRDRCFKAENAVDELGEALKKEQERTSKMKVFFSEFFGDGPKTLEHKPDDTSGSISSRIPETTHIEEAHPFSPPASGEQSLSGTENLSGDSPNPLAHTSGSSGTEDQSNSPEPSHGEAKWEDMREPKPDHYMPEPGTPEYEDWLHHNR